MVRNPRHFTALAATVLILGTLLALSLTVRLLTGPPAAAPELGAAATGWTSEDLPVGSSTQQTPADALAAAIAADLPQWEGRAPRDGVVRVAHADEVNAGGAAGHRVPVTVWVAGSEQVACLQGDAEFNSGPSGVKVRKRALEPVALRVATWSEARRLAEAAAGTALQRSAAPFYGIFRFEGGGRRWAVEAITGQTEEE